jgi:hypothetical protein
LSRPVCFLPFPIVEFQIITEPPVGAHLTIFRAKVTFEGVAKAGHAPFQGK